MVSAKETRADCTVQRRRRRALAAGQRRAGLHRLLFQPDHRRSARSRTWSGLSANRFVAAPTAAEPARSSGARRAATTIISSGSIPSIPITWQPRAIRAWSVSVDDGRTWSSWYNQPTAQFYHLATDDRFPYRIYSGQQDSGTVRIASRSDDGAIAERDWRPAGGDERDYVIPEPRWIQTSSTAPGWVERITRWDARTHQRRGHVTPLSRCQTTGSRQTSVGTPLRLGNTDGGDQDGSDHDLSGRGGRCSPPPTTARPGRRSART